uniref:Uncharacterized protein n=1 Tax=Oryza nivara TaxID=4536 RepID=A0A0E0J4P5_ORYNI
MAALRKEVDDYFDKFHAESYFARQAEAEAVIKEEWAKKDFSRICFRDWDEEAGCYK